MKIAIAGRIYTDNLGDSAIMESSRFLAQSWPETHDVLELDLDGRESRPSIDARSRKPSLPLQIHRQAYSKSMAYGSVFNQLLFQKRKTKMETAWTRVIRDCDLILIGGGQLIQHSRLTFPLRINKLLRLAQDFQRPVAFVGVGVGSIWTPTMRRLYAQVLTAPNVKVIACRDSASCARLAREIPETAGRVRVLSDLALATPLFMGRNENASKVLPGGGVGISPLNPGALKRIGMGGPLSEYSSALEFWASLVEGAVVRFGSGVRLFTTGTKEDLSFAQAVAATASIDLPPIFHPAEADELYAFIERRDAVIAGRLHGSILSWAALVKLQGLLWDPKVLGFAKNVGDLKSFFPSSSSPSEVLEALEALPSLEVRRQLRDAAVCKLVDGFRDIGISTYPP